MIKNVGRKSTMIVKKKGKIKKKKVIVREYFYEIDKYYFGIKRSNSLQVSDRDSI